MNCPNCNKKMHDNTCSYCNYRLTEADQIVDKEKENQFKKYSILYLIFIVLGISLSILSTLFIWFLMVSAVILGSLLFILKNKLAKSSLCTKGKKAYYISLLVLVLIFTLFPAITSITYEIDMITCSKNYNELMGISLPERRPDSYDYYDNHQSGYKNEVYIYEMTDEELNVLLSSKEFKEVTTTSGVYNIFYNLIGRKYDDTYTKFIVYDKLGNKFDYIDDLYIYHNIVIVISEDNTVYLCDMFRAEPKLDKE